VLDVRSAAVLTFPHKAPLVKALAWVGVHFGVRARALTPAEAKAVNAFIPGENFVRVSFLLCTGCRLFSPRMLCISWGWHGSRAPSRRRAGVPRLLCITWWYEGGGQEHSSQAADPHARGVSGAHESGWWGWPKLSLTVLRSAEGKTRTGGWLAWLAVA